MIDTDLDVGPARYRMLEAGRRWRLEADGDTKAGHLKMDVEFEALDPMLIGADGQGGTGRRRHRQHPADGRQGSSRAGRPLVGHGRDRRSEGRTERGRERQPRQVVGSPPLGRDPGCGAGLRSSSTTTTHFGGIVIGSEGWRPSPGLGLWRDGAHESIAEWKVSSDLEEDGITHRASHVTAIDKAGRAHALEAELLRVEPGTRGIKPNRTIVNEGLARWTYEGRAGTGISEYLHQLDGQARPVVPIT